MKRAVLITGGSRGIGNATVQKLKKTGKYEVFAPLRSGLDLSNDESIEKFINKYRDKPIDIIINNAGINNLDFIENISDQNIKDTIQVNLIAPVKLIRGFVNHMKRQRYGRIINISSIFGVVSKEKRTLYSATKFGLNGVTKALAVELGLYNILVNSVCPGFTNTELTKKNISKTERKEIEKDIPLRRFAESEEIADLIEYLISDRNTYITGQTIIIDGGFVCK